MIKNVFFAPMAQRRIFCVLWMAAACAILFQLQPSFTSSINGPPGRSPSRLSMAYTRSKYRVPPSRPMFGDEIRTLYHVTAYGEDIKESGFMLRGNNGTVGGGIYFADCEEAAQRKANSGGYLVVADVHVGKAMRLDISIGPLLVGMGVGVAALLFLPMHAKFKILVSVGRKERASGRGNGSRRHSQDVWLFSQHAEELSRPGEAGLRLCLRDRL
mmetsp:Transcript_42184/g.78459  ORF Transcript_42184/g.78459 Transcript_42184/m.78459 type:complete len:215 (-) Transcript_42184:119-763(-)